MTRSAIADAVPFAYAGSTCRTRSAPNVSPRSSRQSATPSVNRQSRSPDSRSTVRSAYISPGITPSRNPRAGSSSQVLVRA